MSEPRRNPVYKSLHRPLTYLGIDRKLFIIVAVTSMATMELLHSLLAAALVFVASASMAYWVTQKDPAFLIIALKADKFRARYDAAKQQIPNVEIR